jgi:hypothetical protein
MIAEIYSMPPIAYRASRPWLTIVSASAAWTYSFAFTMLMFDDNEPGLILTNCVLVSATTSCQFGTRAHASPFIHRVLHSVVGAQFRDRVDYN